MQAPIRMVMFDLAGTTIDDGTAVADCLYEAAAEFGIATSSAEIAQHIGTNKIHLYQFLLAREAGREVNFADFEKQKDPATRPRAEEIFHRYTEIMINYYHQETRPMPGAVETFRWLHQHGIKVATDTGFHRDVNTAIMDNLGWIRDGLVDIAVDVEHIPGDRGRPAPFMIFHAMQALDIQSVHEVVKVGDTPADMLEGINAGCAAVIGVMSGPLPTEKFSRYRHTHIIPSVADLPELLTNEFGIGQ
jgi:phosphonatase-like hydrolase